jgi:hypothetical protein
MNNFVKLLNSACVFSRLLANALGEWATTQTGPVVEAVAGLREDFITAAQEEGLPEHIQEVIESWGETREAVQKMAKEIDKVFETSDEEV